MKVKYSTTLKCQGCVDNVAKQLNEAFGEENWEVDLSSNPKILTVKNPESPDKAIKILESKGYRAEILNNE
ncbi:heavy-metal-associated domain-containing protein [Schleiferia thermophila]|uniref:Copper chaperone CopZ n=1 Tax=Schleiferia thermophila TaxID=884107 RepID=A0A369A9J9_9FLAO|nr:heavy metal-associated domain-containing protein [Schleiferia thermophila]RCX05078.1 copper chaperone CopZ [Schleiferia thermophila]GCD79404.1 hypothetical protein JCM30197_06510 [Schleiferia thermophila]